MQSVSEVTQAGEPTLDLKSLQQWMSNNQLDFARQYLEQKCEQFPSSHEPFYYLAACCRYQKDFVPAKAALEHARKLDPNNSRVLQEQGHFYRDQKKFDQALSFYQQATRQNPVLLSAWHAQRDILKTQSNQTAYHAVLKQITHLDSLPKALLAIQDLMAQGRLVKAEQLVRHFLQQVPHHIEAMRLLAEIGLRLGVLDDAEFLLASAIKLDPSNLQLHVDYLQALSKRQKYSAAYEQANWLLAKHPENHQFKSLVAIQAMHLALYDKAVNFLDQVLNEIPGEPITLTTRGHALKTAGRNEEAIASYREALTTNPKHGEAWYALANLKTYQFSEQDIQHMLANIQAEGLSSGDTVHLSFALGKAFEDRQLYDQSFSFYRQGNSLKKAQSRYEANAMTQELTRQQEIITSELMARYSGAGCDAKDPIFIVGMPRAGSTLLEQILSSHSQVDGTLELPNIIALAQKLRRGDRLSHQSHYPEVLLDIDPQMLRLYGENYLEETRIHRQGAAYFIDKMPNNFRHIGLIKLILPNAKIIDARRSAPACCFGGFKQLFAQGQEFSYDLADIGQYYRDYVDLMDHWQALFPDEILLMEYENVVDDLEGSVRKLLEYCGLPFEEQCLEFHKTERAVRTASSEQVRQIGRAHV